MKCVGFLSILQQNERGLSLGSTKQYSALANIVPKTKVPEKICHMQTAL